MVTVAMRTVIGGMVATIVLIVAATTLIITYTVALSSLRGIAEELSVSLVNVASRKTENFFEEPARHLRVIQNFHALPGIMLPSDEPDISNWADKWIQLLYSILVYSNNTYGSMAIAWEDGSGIYASQFNPPLNTEVYLWATNMKNAASNGGLAEDVFVHRNLVNPGLSRKTIGHNDTGTDPRGDARIELYHTSRTFFPGPQGFFGPMTGFKPGSDSLWLLLGAGIHVYNASGMNIGSATLARDFRELSSFLREIVTGDMQAFAVDKNRYVIGSTLRDPYYTVTCETSTLVPAGCLSARATTIRQLPCWDQACFTAAEEFTYVPLASAAKQFQALITTSSQGVELFKADDGDSYYVVSSNVPNSFRSFKLNLLLIMPEERIIGDIQSGRTVAIVSAVGIFVVVTTLAFLLVYLLLKPLNLVSDQMKETAKLRDKDEMEELSLSYLTEVRQLQKSYSNMSSAIQSFTRYVPKDVVKDLMSSGQLCEISMQDMCCSILFIDIRGFTTICERVPADALSELVTKYFDVMSRIVMKHDGLIDKYIGDCIMAVWGAPFPCPNHEVKSTLTALLLHTETLNDPLATAFDEAGEVLGVRVGVNTGHVLAGNMGSAARMNYTVIGDPVNLAARLESMNKQFGTQVMISEDTAEGCGTIFVLRLLMSIAVVGKAVPVKVYEVVAVNPELSEADREMIKSAEYDVQKALDTMSESSHRSESLYAQAASDKKRVSALTMVMEVLQSPHPPVVEEVDVKFCYYFTEAVKAYLIEKFTKSLDILGHAEAKSESAVCQRSEKSIAVLRGLAEDANKDPSVFCGYYAAAEK